MNAPKKITYLIAVILGVVGIVGRWIPFLAGFSFWLLAAGFVLLAIACLLKGL